jgi:hypothetical protein
MAYIGKDGKAKRAPAIKALLAKYGIKGSLSIRNNSCLILSVRSGKIDFIKNFNDSVVGCPYLSRLLNSPARDSLKVSSPRSASGYYHGDAKDFLLSAIAILMGSDYHDRSDIMSDYFDVSHYISIDIGRWDKPYVLVS